MKQLVVFVCLLALGFLALHWWQPIRHHRIANAETIIGLVGIVYLLIVVLMLAHTKRWTIRALGLLAVLAGDAVFWLDLLWTALDKQHNLPGSPPPVAITNDLILDLFLWGGTFLLLSIIHQTWVDRRGGDE